jgi:phosphatidylglycerol:prolipoprotein diacylglycerol transferase
MHPDLFSIGFLHIKTYGCCMALGFFAAWHVLAYLCRRIGRPFDPIGNLVISLMVSGVVGSRIAYVIEHWQSEFADRPMDIIRVDQGGLMFYGGFILSFVIFFLWCFIKKERPLVLADLLCIVLPLGHAFGRIGCFFYGCCYGRDSNAWCAVVFPAGSPSWYEHGRKMVSVLPTQLFEAAALLALFAALLAFWHRKTFMRSFGEGALTGLYMIGYGAIRFGIEYLRGDPRAAVGPFSISQTISIGLMMLGVSFVLFSRIYGLVVRAKARFGLFLCFRFYFWCVTPYPNRAKSPLQGSSGQISLKASVISRAVTMSF